MLCIELVFFFNLQQYSASLLNYLRNQQGEFALHSLDALFETNCNPRIISVN